MAGSALSIHSVRHNDDILCGGLRAVCGGLRPRAGLRRAGRAPTFVLDCSARVLSLTDITHHHHPLQIPTHVNNITMIDVLSLVQSPRRTATRNRPPPCSAAWSSTLRKGSARYRFRRHRRRCYFGLAPLFAMKFQNKSAFAPPPLPPPSHTHTFIVSVGSCIAKQTDADPHQRTHNALPSSLLHPTLYVFSSTGSPSKSAFSCVVKKMRNQFLFFSNGALLLLFSCFRQNNSNICTSAPRLHLKHVRKLYSCRCTIAI